MTTESPTPDPSVKWDGKKISVSLPVDGKVLDAEWVPSITYVVRVREFGVDEWSFGFETPIAGCTIVDLKPGTEYEMQLRAKNAAGEGEPTYSTFRTNSDGAASNGVAFPEWL